MTAAPAGRSAAGLLRWATAGAVVLAAHGGSLWYVLRIAPSQAAMGGVAAPILIDLAPVVAAPEAEPQDVAPGPQAQEAQPEAAPEAKPEPIQPEQEKPAPEPEPVVERPIEIPPLPDIPPPDFKVTDLPRKEEAQAVLPPPPPPPRRPQRPPPKKQEAERRKPVNPERPKSRQTSAPPALAAPHAPAAVAPSPAEAAAAAAAKANWRSQLSAHLNRFKRFPSGAVRTGTAAVNYSLSRTGAVVAARLVTSSGDAALDEEAVAMVRRANPFPAPPPGYTETLTFTQAIRFNR